MSSYTQLCTKVLNDFIHNKDAKDFLDPVPWEEWNLLDYPTIIKKPMDLHSIESKLQNNEYHDAYEFANDMRLIWSNCLKYNPEGTPIRHLAEKLQVKFEDAFNKLVSQLAPEEKMPNVDVKTTFANNFGLLSAQQISYIVSELRQTCPDALIETTEGVCDIVVDKISVYLFHKLNAYISDCLNENCPICSKE